MRNLAYALFAAALVAVDVLLIYAFFTYLWPRLPSWAILLCFIALSVFLIGSPILWLLRLSKKVPIPEHLRRRQDS